MSTSPHLKPLLSRWLESRKKGNRLPPEVLCKDHPELLPAVKRYIEAAERKALQTAACDAGETTALPRQPADGPAPPSGPLAGLDFLGPAQARGELGRLGNFRVTGVLGEGGMGLVLDGEDLGLRRPVAIKVVRPQAAQAPEAKQRFLREARAAAQLESPHIVPIYHVGQQGNALYLVMPRLQGRTLANRLAGGAALPPTEVARIGREVAEGLAVAHDAGLVHRDVKPANVWLREPGDTAVLLDFGLAASAGERQQLTRTGLVVGTPAYMAPEQADGQKPGPEGDLFSLGCVLYESCTGQRAFDGPTTLSILKKLATHTPPPPRQLSPEVPPKLSRLIVELMQRDPDERPESARDVARQLAEIERRLNDPEVTEVMEAEEPEPPRQKKPRKKREREWDRAERRGGGKLLVPLLAGGGVLAVALVALGAWVVASRPAPRAAGGPDRNLQPPAANVPQPPAGNQQPTFSRVDTTVKVTVNGGASLPRGWTVYSSFAGRYSIGMPGKPRVVQQVLEKSQTTVHRAEMTDSDLGVNLGVNYADLGTVGKAEQRLEASRDALVESMRLKVNRETRLTIGGHPGLELDADGVIEGKPYSMRLRIFIVRDRMYQVLAGASTRDPLYGPSINLFMESFRLKLLG